MPNKITDLGACFQKSVAYIFEIPIKHVPHFCLIYSDDTWWNRFQDFCILRGVYPLCFKAGSDKEKEYLMGRHLIQIKLECGIEHCVVGERGKIIYDPSGKSNIKSIESYTIFVSLMNKK